MFFEIMSFYLEVPEKFCVLHWFFFLSSIQGQYPIMNTSKDVECFQEVETKGQENGDHIVFGMYFAGFSTLY